MKNYILLFALSFTFLFAQAQPESFGFKPAKSCDATSVKSQGRTGTCWCFSTQSFLESEMLRIGGERVDLSEMFVVRKNYLEKAELYIRFQGKTQFSQGSLGHDVIRIAKKYGLMPESAYSGMKGEMHNHSDLEPELKAYLDTLLAQGTIDMHWRNGFATILDKHLGALPASFEYNGESYSAQSFAQSLNLPWNAYVGLTTFTHHPSYSAFAVEVPDNYSRGEYHNVSLTEMVQTIDDALAKGYSIEWDGDVSEPGFVAKSGLARMTSAEEIENPEAKETTITPSIRQQWFDSQVTTDDHLMHIVGFTTDKNGVKYYMVKNSWGTGSGVGGYIFMSEAYLKAKTVCIILHKDGIPENVVKNLSLN